MCGEKSGQEIRAVPRPEKDLGRVDWWGGSTAGRVFALHVANLDSISRTP